MDVYALLCLVGAVSCTFVAKDEQFCITFGKSQIISDLYSFRFYLVEGSSHHLAHEKVVHEKNNNNVDIQSSYHLIRNS